MSWRWNCFLYPTFIPVWLRKMLSLRLLLLELFLHILLLSHFVLTASQLLLLSLKFKLLLLSSNLLLLLQNLLLMLNLLQLLLPLLFLELLLKLIVIQFWSLTTSASQSGATIPPILYLRIHRLVALIILCRVYSCGHSVILSLILYTLISTTV